MPKLKSWLSPLPKLAVPVFLFWGDCSRRATSSPANDYVYDRLIGIRQSVFHVDADLRDAIPPASEMPGHVGALPVADKRVDFTYDQASQPQTLTRYADLAGNQLIAATD